MIDYALLKAVWPTVTGATVQAKLDALNQMTVAGPKQDVDVNAVADYLGMSGAFTAMEDWLAANVTPSPPRTAAKELLRYISRPGAGPFRTSDPTTFAALQGSLNALVAVNLLTQDQVTALLGMANTTRPWWEANGFTSPISQTELTVAGLS